MQEVYYFIDGYNLMFRSIDAQDDFTHSRQNLILALNRKAALLKLHISIFFDSQYHLGEETRTHYQHVEIFFSAEGETADECILRAIHLKKNPKQTTVVTSDKKLAWFARRCEANTQSIEFFSNWLERRYRNRLEKGSIKHVNKASKNQNKIAQLIKEGKNLPVNKENLESHESYFNYYLEEFQKKLEITTSDAPGPSPLNKQIKQIKKKKKKLEKPREPFLSDMERWEKVFKERWEKENK